MEIQIQSIHFKADQKLIDFINEKLEKLTQYYDRIISCEVYLRLDKSEESANKVGEVKVKVPGNDFFVKNQCKTFEEAIDLCAVALQKQIKKHKEKQLGV